jgi:hypothetical protein
MKKVLLLSAIAVSMISLIGCGSGGSGSESAVTDSNTTTMPEVGASLFSGRVADGYLVGALVCQDINLNNECDSGEPQTYSGDFGIFTLNIPVADAINGPLLVNAFSGLTVDEDDGLRITNDYTLSAPAGYSFVSPLTTMVQAKIDENRADSEYTVADAISEVGLVVGSSDVMLNYVASENTRLHNISKIIANTIGLAKADVSESVLAANNISNGDFIRSIVSNILESLKNISDSAHVSEVITDPVAFINSRNLLAMIDTDVEEIKNFINYREILNDADYEKTNLLTEIETQGATKITLFNVGANGLGVVSSAYQSEGGDDYSLINKRVLGDSEEWVETDTSFQDGYDFSNIDGEWVRKDDSFTLTSDLNDTTTLNYSTTAHSTTFETVKVSADGWNIGQSVSQLGYLYSFSQPMSELIDSEAIFSADAEIYISRETRRIDGYDYSPDDVEVILNARNSDVATTLAGVINTETNNGNAFTSAMSSDFTIRISKVNGENISEFYGSNGVFAGQSDWEIVGTGTSFERIEIRNPPQFTSRFVIPNNFLTVIDGQVIAGTQTKNWSGRLTERRINDAAISDLMAARILPITNND